MLRACHFVAATALLASLIGANGEARAFTAGKPLLASLPQHDLIRKVHGSHRDCKIGSYSYIASTQPGQRRAGALPGVAAPRRVTVKNGYGFHRHSVAAAPGVYMGSACAGMIAPKPIAPR